MTTVPRLYVSLQSAPQLIPAGDELTVPLPSPARARLSVYMLWGEGGGDRARCTHRDLARAGSGAGPSCSRAKTQPVAGVADRVTTVPAASLRCRSL